MSNMKLTRLYHPYKFSRTNSILNTVFGNHGTVAKEDDLTQNWVLQYFTVACQCLGENNNEKYFIPTCILLIM